jgi:Spy/CpxP family protein refolding chaperone
MRRTTALALTLSIASFAFSGIALAQPGLGGGFGRGGGMRMGGMGGMGGRCAGMVMRAHPDVLKARLGLSDQQVQQLVPLRNNLMSKSITLRAQAAQLGVQLKTVMEADLPDQAKVLDLMRKMRGVRGQLQEERAKAGLKAMQILTKDQRTKLRTECGPGAGWGRRGAFGPGGFGPGGRGRRGGGWGGGAGGWGGGGGGGGGGGWGGPADE